MSQLILTIQSESKKKSALGVLDIDEGFIYYQVESFSSGLSHQNFRGLACNDDFLYATTPTSLMIYKINDSSERLLFDFKKEIVLPEWMLLSNTPLSGLMPVYWSEKRQKLYVGCNTLSSIDEFDIDGNFLGRTNLWDISSELFPISKTQEKKCPYGHIRSITECPTGNLIITVAHRTSENINSVINIDDGRIVLDELAVPHGGKYFSNSFYIHDAHKAELVSYSNELQAGEMIRQWSVKPRILSNETYNSFIRLRGISIINDNIYCSLFSVRKQKKHQFTPRIVGFDRLTGIQNAEFILPEIEGFGKASVVSLLPIPMDKKLDIPDSPILIQDGQYMENAQISKTINSINNSDLSIPSEEIVNPVTVKVEDISVSYLRSPSFGFGADKQLRKVREFWALNSVSFDIRKAEIVGLIGRNGSGKSTLGMLIGGILKPDKGKIKVTGKAQLLSIGVGFRTELTGRDNVFLAGSLLGLSKNKITEQFNEIENFAELGDFIDEPIRTYSAGMRSRLAFAISTAVQPEVLILDEILSTGDQTFGKKAANRILEMQSNANTVIIVSHNPNYLKKVCTRIIWLDKGKLIQDGKPREVLFNYRQYCKNPDQWLADHIVQN